MGVKAVGIFDIDFFKGDGKKFSKTLKAFGIPQSVIDSLGQLRGNVKKFFDNSGRDMKKDGGINILTGDEKRTAETLINLLKDHGLFIVPTGELESWSSFRIF